MIRRLFARLGGCRATTTKPAGLPVNRPVMALASRLALQEQPGVYAYLREVAVRFQLYWAGQPMASKRPATASTSSKDHPATSLALPHRQPALSRTPARSRTSSATAAPRAAGRQDGRPTVLGLRRARRSAASATYRMPGFAAIVLDLTADQCLLQAENVRGPWRSELLPLAPRRPKR